MTRYYNGLDSTNVSNIRQEIEDVRLNPTYDEAFLSVKENINYVSGQIKTLNDKYENRFSDNVKVTYRGGEEIVITNSTQMILLGAYEVSELYKITGSGIYEGKRITLIFYNSMTTVKNSGYLNSIVKDRIILSKLLDTNPVANCTIDLIRVNGTWIETSRNY